VCEEDVSNSVFPYYTYKRITIDAVSTLALRVSYVGELGWEFYAPTEYGLKLWDVLWNSGKSFGVIAAGMGAFDSLRLEKGYRLWGADIHTEYNPYEAGLDWAVQLNKGDFLGRKALIKNMDGEVSRKLCCMTLDDPKGMVLGKEPILDGNQRLGYVTSSNFGYSIGKLILYGYLPVEYTHVGTKVEIEYFGERYTATVRSEPLYDPEMKKLKL
jgi:glycine cleavage system aminomethyltransferase T